MDVALLLTCHMYMLLIAVRGIGYPAPNEVRYALGDLAALAYKDVIRESIVGEGSDTVPALIADLGIRGVWLPQIESLFDIRVTDADTPSYLSRSVRMS